ncbi:MAG: T9SS type A sorting domain-containing protein [Bacteroidota bacterium]|nr:T9SS type A sorting domain-containing protein [Bacteroidota bacterium]
MKKFILILVLGILTSTISFAQIPNGDFETQDNWTASGKATYVERLDATLSGDPVSLYPESGSKFIRVQNDLTQGKLGVLSSSFPLTSRPNYYSFHAGYISANKVERFGFIVFFWKWNTNTNSRDTILYNFGAAPQQDGQLQPWAVLNMDLSSLYKNTDTPDSAMLVFIVDVRQNTQGQIIASDNTVLVLDNLKFEQQTSSGITWSDIEAENSIAINKAYYFNKRIFLNIENYEPSNLNLTLTNMRGQRVLDKKINLIGKGNINESINVDYLPKGIYILGILSDKGILESKKILIK